MKKQLLLVTTLAMLLVSCNKDTTSSYTSTTQDTSTTQESTTTTTQEDTSFKFSSGTSAADYLQDLINATKDGNYTLEYNDGSDDYIDIFTSKYITIRDEYNGYILLDSYNKNDSVLGEKILYTFVNENNTPVLSLPTVKNSYGTLTIARSFDDINYIKKSLNESSPLAVGAMTENADGTVTIKDSGYSYYTAINDLISIFHTSNISYWSLDRIVLSKTLKTLTLDFYSSSSEEPIASATIKNVNESSSEVVETNLASLTLPTESIGYTNLNHLRDNRFTTKTTIKKISSTNEETIGIRGSNISLYNYEFITYDYDGTTVTDISSNVNKNGEMYEVKVNAKNEVEEVKSSYEWDEYFYDFSQYLDPQAFRKTTGEHDYEYFGVYYEDILGALSYLTTSSYGNLRHLYADTDDNGKVNQFVAVFEDVTDTDDNIVEHIEMTIEIVSDKEFEEVVAYTSTDDTKILETAMETSFNSTTSYKATVMSGESGSTYKTYEIYYNVNLKSIIREKYTTTDGTTSLDSVDGYKLLEGTTNDGITYFSYDIENKTATATKKPKSGTLDDMQLLNVSPLVFNKSTDQTYFIKNGIYNVGGYINFDHGSSYSDNTLQIILNDDNTKISSVAFTCLDYYSTVSDIISFDYTDYTPSSDIQTAIEHLAPFVEPTNWVDFNSEVGAKLTTYFGSEETAKTVPFIYTELVETWRVSERVEYDDSWNEIEGSNYLNIYPGTYNYNDYDDIIEYYQQYINMLEADTSWTKVEDESNSTKTVFSNSTMKVTIWTRYVSDGIIIKKISA